MSLSGQPGRLGRPARACPREGVAVSIERQTCATTLGRSPTERGDAPCERTEHGAPITQGSQVCMDASRDRQKLPHIQTR